MVKLSCSYLKPQSIIFVTVLPTHHQDGDLFMQYSFDRSIDIYFNQEFILAMIGNTK